MPRRIVAATLMLTFTLTSCHVWRPLEGVPRPVPETVRVELTSGVQVELSEARIEGDTLVGWRLGESGAGAPGSGASTRFITRIPVDRIGSLQARSLSGLRTFLFVVGIPVASLGVLAAIVMSDFDPLGGT